MAAVAMMQIRQLGRVGEPEWRTVFIFSCFVCLSSLVGLALEGWKDIGVVSWFALTGVGVLGLRSEEHTSELQSLMRISYAVFCLKKKKTIKSIININLIDI